MRELVIERLKNFIHLSDGYGIPRCFDCDEVEHVTNPDELNTMSDQELLEVFEACVGFQG